MLGTKYFILLIAISAFISIPINSVRADTTTRWYAGYTYSTDGQGLPAGDAPWGVKPNVLTKSPSIPLGHQLCQWSSVVFSYSQGYWLQLGYLKKYSFWVLYVKFYMEVYDSTTNWQYWIPGVRPETGHTYSYAIYNIGPFGTYKLAIMEGSSWKWSYNRIVYPYEPVDLQVKVEGTTWSIDIDGSHFTHISYYDDSAPLNWRYWDQYLRNYTPPFFCQYISSYEFKASNDVL